MAASADSVRVSDGSRQGEILPGGRWFNVIVWDDGSKTIIDKPNLTAILDPRR